MCLLWQTTRIAKPERLWLDFLNPMRFAYAEANLIGLTFLQDMDSVKELSKFSAATICEAFGNRGHLSSGIKPIAANIKVCWPAYTVQTMLLDNVLLYWAYTYAQAGDVLIVNCSEFYEAGYWGDLMSLCAKIKGINGLVINVWPVCGLVIFQKV